MKLLGQLSLQFKYFALISLVGTLAACGGGGHSNASANAPQPTASSPTLSSAPASSAPANSSAISVSSAVVSSSLLSSAASSILSNSSKMTVVSSVSSAAASSKSSVLTSSTTSIGASASSVSAVSQSSLSSLISSSNSSLSSTISQSSTASVPPSAPDLGGFPSTPLKVMPGTTAAALGNPTTAKTSGLSVVLDKLHHMPKHAVPATWGTFPAELNKGTVPSISDISILNRRDALIIYVPAVKGAADYRAYLYNASKVSFVGEQPRGAVIACAGYRQRGGRGVESTASNTAPATHRELLQALEVPGLVADGNYTVIVEAIATPCPFTGVMAHTTAKLYDGTSAGTLLRGFNDVRGLYGNEILNGQGSEIPDYQQPDVSQGLAFPKGQPVSPTSTTIPADPTIIARSAITVVRPAADEAQNGPIFDVGPNAVFDDFSTDGVMTSLVPGIRGEGSGLTSEGQFGDWFFWMSQVQQGMNNAGVCCENGAQPKGIQIWRRHGRLYDTFGDWGQDTFSVVNFSSTKTRPLALDTSKYVHSMFRVDTNATGRRYWTWSMCGGNTREEMVDPITGIPRIRPIGSANFYLPIDIGGLNPTGFFYPENSTGTKTPYHEKECISLFQIAANYQYIPLPDAVSWMDEPHSELRAVLHPAVRTRGVMNLKQANMNDGDTDVGRGMMWRLNGDHKPTGPMFEPFDQFAPLTHMDIFVRPDRIIFYVNGRQAWCSDLSDRPLTMKYGLIVYGSALYHSGAEMGEIYQGGSGGNFHYAMNTIYTDTRVWDLVAHSEKIDIPTQMQFDPRACFKPASYAVGPTATQ